MANGALAPTVDAVDALAALDATASRAADLTPVWEGVADPALREMFREVWATEGASIGEKWAPLSPVTLAFKARHGRAGKGILRFTDDLLRSLTVRSGLNQVKQVEALSLTFGTQDPKAALHQDGWTTGTIFGRPRTASVTVPARPMVPDTLPASVLETIEAGMARYITEGAL